MIRKIVSSGQSGAQKAALDAARESGLIDWWGGHAPRGRLDEGVGQIADDYFAPPFKGDSDRPCGLVESSSSRIEDVDPANVDLADATLFFWMGKGLPEFRAAVDHSKRVRTPYVLVDPWKRFQFPKVLRWFCTRNVETINIMGPRKGSSLYEITKPWISSLISQSFIHDHWGIDIWDIKTKPPTTTT